MIEKPTREKYLDILKFVAIAAVILTHVASDRWYEFYNASNLTSDETISCGILLGIARCGVPIFLMVSGGILLNKKYTLGKLLRRISLLFVSLVVLLIINELLNTILYTNDYQNIAKNVVNQLVYGTGPSYCWYLYSLIGIYIILPLLKAFVDGVTKEIYIYILVLIFLAQSLLPFIGSYLPWDISVMAAAMLDGSGDFSIFVGYFLLGYYIEKYGFNISKILMVSLGLIGLALVIYQGISHPDTMEQYIKYYMPGVVFYSTSLYVALRKLAKRVAESKASIVFADIGRKTLGIYILHIPVMTLMGYFSINGNKYEALIFVPIYTVEIMLITYAVVFVLRFIPVVNKII